MWLRFSFSSTYPAVLTAFAVIHLASAGSKFTEIFEGLEKGKAALESAGSSASSDSFSHLRQPPSSEPAQSYDPEGAAGYSGRHPPPTQPPRKEFETYWGPSSPIATQFQVWHPEETSLPLHFEPPSDQFEEEVTSRLHPVTTGGATPPWAHDPYGSPSQIAHDPYGAPPQMAHYPYGAPPHVAHDPYGAPPELAHSPYGAPSEYAHYPYDVPPQMAHYTYGAPPPMVHSSPPRDQIQTGSSHAAPSLEASQAAQSVQRTIGQVVMHPPTIQLGTVLVQLDRDPRIDPIVQNWLATLHPNEPLSKLIKVDEFSDRFIAAGGRTAGHGFLKRGSFIRIVEGDRPLFVTWHQDPSWNRGKSRSTIVVWTMHLNEHKNVVMTAKGVYSVSENKYWELSRLENAFLYQRQPGHHHEGLFQRRDK